MSVRRDLISDIKSAQIAHTYRPIVHEEGDILNITVTAVHPKVTSNITLSLDKFVGGGFAGQVYKATVQNMSTPVDGLEINGIYAVKILKPPSRFSVLFRDIMYWLGYQSAFALEVSESAIRAGALWQKLIRRGAKIEFGTEQTVVNGYATFFDEELRSWAEISEWVPGRTWHLEIDDSLFSRWKSDPTKWDSPQPNVSSPEYQNKRLFMYRLVKLFHKMGAPELARQYEWYSLKSQPNALKRLGSSDDPSDGLTAIDFRAGLALVFPIAMSPIDFILMFRGLLRGSLVQFDRGSIEQLNAYIKSNSSSFEDLKPVIEELIQQDNAYRRSLLDITHHHFKLLNSDLRKDIRFGYINAWHVKGLIDQEHKQTLINSGFLSLIFVLIGTIPVMGKIIRKFWGNAVWRQHIKHCLTSFSYLLETLRVKRLETLVTWHRQGRVDDTRAQKLAKSPILFTIERLLLGFLPTSIHHLITVPSYFWNKLTNAVTYPIKLYFSADFREQWLKEQVAAAKTEGMLDEEEEKRILESIADPFIQTYLKCVAVHAATLPITQVVAGLIAAYYYFFHAQTWEEGLVTAGLILAFFQGTPVSPGSLTRGSYVVYRMIKDRNVKDYWVAALISFWHYVGYLGFPIQMVARFPGLARFMGGSWATKAARIIPVFGEKGALIEHLVFDTFFNLPISIGALFRRKNGRKPENE